MTEPNDKIMNRIRALLTKAESTEFTDEADALTAKAYDLMATHGIEQALLGARLPNSDKPGDRRIRIPAPYAGVKSLLFNGLSQALRCRAVRIEKGRTDILHVFGFQSDLERLDVLYTSLLLQATHRMTRLQPPPYEGVRMFRRSWLLGFVVTVVERVKEAEAAARHAAERAETPGDSQPGIALVLADRKAVVSQLIENAYPNATPGGKVSARGSGYRQGARDGATANIGTTGLGSRATAQIGR